MSILYLHVMAYIMPADSPMRSNAEAIKMVERADALIDVPAFGGGNASDEKYLKVCAHSVDEIKEESYSGEKLQVEMRVVQMRKIDRLEADAGTLRRRAVDTHIARYLT